jgi:hypothetical protein
MRVISLKERWTRARYLPLLEIVCRGWGVYLSATLGLWVSDEIVRKHGGWIRVRSLSEGRVKGTAFEIFIPANAETADR